MHTRRAVVKCHTDTGWAQGKRVHEKNVRDLEGRLGLQMRSLGLNHCRHGKCRAELLGLRRLVILESCRGRVFIRYGHRHVEAIFGFGSSNFGRQDPDFRIAEFRFSKSCRLITEWFDKCFHCLSFLHIAGTSSGASAGATRTSRPAARG